MPDDPRGGAAVHPVETQWHHPIMTARGFTAETPSAVGFVRRYVYRRGERVIRLHTGVNADYWIDELDREQGLWSGLEAHLRGLDVCGCGEPGRWHGRHDAVCCGGEMCCPHAEE